MSNISRLESFYDFFNKREYAKIMQLLHEDIIWREAVGTNQEVVIFGKDDVHNQVLKQIPIHWEEVLIYPTLLLSEGDTVVVTTQYNVIERISKKTLITGAAHIWKLKDNKLIEHESYINTVSEVE
jgi:ketosteroid isomerase-like protein